MDLPDVVRDALGDESVAARVPLGGADLLLVTATRTIVYRGDGLLSDESVEEFPHASERIEVEEGRRKARIRLDYGLDGERTLALPAKKLSEAFHPILAGVLNAAGVTDPGEAVKQTFRFSELTVVVTGRRLVKHVGSVVWDEDYEEYHYDDVTDLRFEEGRHGTAVVIEQDGRSERFKVPNESARLLRESLVDAVLDYHGYDDVAAFREARAAQPADAEREGDEGASTSESSGGAMAFGSGLDPLDTGSDGEDDAGDDSGDRVDIVGVGQSADDEAAAGGGDGATSEGDAAPEGSSDGATPVVGGADPGNETSTSSSRDDEVAAEVAALRAAVEAQNERLDRQEELLSTLIEELRRGR